MTLATLFSLRKGTPGHARLIYAGLLAALIPFLRAYGLPRGLCATLQRMKSIVFFVSYFWFSRASGGREI